jgi:PhnB protein
MAGASERVPEGYRTVTPHLTIRGATDAIEFYKKAFGAREIRRSPGPDGKLMHAEIQIGDSRIFLNDEFPEMGASSPLALKGTPVTMHLYVEDCDGIFDRALKAGATAAMPLADQFWGDRYGLLVDPFGHRWAVASHIKDMTPEQMRAAAGEAMKQMAKK